MSDDNKRPNIPLFLRAKDIAILEDCTQVAAQSKLTRYKKALGISRLSTSAYCEKNHISKDDVAWHLNRIVILFIKCAAAAVLISCSTRFIDYPKIWDAMKVKWLEQSSTYRRGFLEMEDKKTGKKSPVMVIIKDN
jgi:hypothetical protein